MSLGFFMDVEVELFGFQDGAEGFVQYDGVSVDAEGHPTGNRIFLMVAGGMGSGKTVGGAFRTVRYLLEHPGAQIMIVAPTYPMIIRATLPTLFWALDKAGLQRNIHYDYTDTRKELTLPFNGSRAWVVTTEHPDDLRGPTIAAFWMDEPRGSPEYAFQLLQGRLRQQGYPLQGWLTTTPAGKRNWMFKYFFPEDYAFLEGEALGEKGQDEYKAYRALTKDNPFGGVQLHQSLLRSYGSERSPLARQELFGEFIVIEGAVYPDWNSSYHVKDVATWPTTQAGRKCGLVVAGVDFGFENPFAIEVEGYDSETKTRYVLDEYCKSHIEPDDQARICLWLQRRHNIDTFYCDATNPTMIRHLRSWGVRAVRAKNRKGTQADPTFGIGAVTAALNSKGREGIQGLYVNPKCKHLALQMESYTEDAPKENREKPEEPRGHHYDACDAFRYAETGLLRHIGHNARRGVRFVDVRYG